MNESVFKIKINEAAAFLRKIDFLKDYKSYNIGVYSQASIDAAKTDDISEIYQSIIDNHDWELLLKDDSIFQFSKDNHKLRYTFIQSHLMYFSFRDFLVEINDSEDTQLSEDEIKEMEIAFADDYEQRRCEQKINSGAMYLRYDVDDNGYDPNTHSYAHMHIGINNSMRIPCKLILTPFAFVMFVVKQVYISQWEQALREGIINNEILQYKQLCDNVPDGLWDVKEERELYIL